MSDDLRLVRINLRIWLMRPSSAAVPRGQRKDMIYCLSSLQRIHQSVRRDLKREALPNVWNDRLDC